MVAQLLCALALLGALSVAGAAEPQLAASLPNAEGYGALRLKSPPAGSAICARLCPSIRDATASRILAPATAIDPGGEISRTRLPAARSALEANGMSRLPDPPAYLRFHRYLL